MYKDHFQLSQNNLLKRLFFPPLKFWHPCQKKCILVYFYILNFILLAHKSSSLPISPRLDYHSKISNRKHEFSSALLLWNAISIFKPVLTVCLSITSAFHYSSNEDYKDSVGCLKQKSHLHLLSLPIHRCSIFFYPSSFPLISSNNVS